MGAVSAHKSTTLYVLFDGKHYFLSTLETSRAKAWAYARRYCRAKERKEQDRELKAGGWRCVPVKIEVAAR